MDTGRVAVSAAVVGLAGFVAQYAPARLVNQWFQDGSSVLPTVGTTGQTVVTYNLLAGATGLIATVLLAVWVGQRLGDRLDLTVEYRQFVIAVVVGTLASAIAGLAGLWLVDGLPSAGPVQGHVFMTLAFFVRLVATVSLVVALGLFAGAALSHFRGNDERSARPTGAGTGVRDA